MLRAMRQRDKFRTKLASRSTRKTTRNARPQIEGLEARVVLTLTPVVNPINEVEGLSDPAIQVGTITDSDLTVTPANLTVTVDFGDGSAPLDIPPAQIQQTGPGTFTVTANHTFAEESGSVVPPGAFAVSMTVQDTKNAVQATAAGQAFVNDAPLAPGNPIAAGAPQQFSGVGGAAVAQALTAFKAAVGGPDQTAAAGPQGSGFRTIDWDGVKVDGTDLGGGANTTVVNQGHTVGIPLNRFQTRGVYFGAVYAVSNDGFTDVNPTTAGLFPPFSPANTFAMFNDNGIDFKFVAPSAGNTTVVSAASRGFGAVFVNVREPDTTSIEFFHGATSLGTIFAPVGAAGQPEFVGDLFQSPIVTNVVLTLGTDVIFSFDGTTFSSNTSDNSDNGHNLVVTDDWVYAEPVPIANGFPIVSGPQGATNAPSIVTATAGVAAQNVVVATFTDLDPAANANDFTATINWGDGHSTNGLLKANAAGGFDVVGSNTYAKAGKFAINVDVADFGGGPGAGGSSPTLSINNTATVAQAEASIVLTTSAASLSVGQPVTLTATVGAAQGTASPTGFVEFRDGAISLGFAPIVAGRAELTVPKLAIGTHSLSSNFLGDANFSTSSSNVVGEVVSPDVTAHFAIVRGKIKRVGRQFRQTITLQNIGGFEVASPIELVLDGLGKGVTLKTNHGVTKITPPLGSPFVVVLASGVPALLSGGSISVMLNFQSKSAAAITFTPRVLAGVVQV
jgi:Bacterial Ig-like domain (group 3)